MSFNTEEISYRKADIQDIDILVDFRVRFLNELDNHPDDEEADNLRTTLREYFSQKIPSGEFIAWFAEEDGKILGTSGIVMWQIPGRYGGLELGKAGYILNMFTVPEARGQGICTCLITRLIDEARAIGLKYLHLHASSDGNSIYRKMGFSEPEMPELRLILD